MKEVEEILSEAVILSRINHPNIVRVFDAGVVETTQGQRGFFTMEFVAGGTLEKFWRSYGISFVPVRDAVEIIRQVCSGLAVAHSESPPIVHRDIKPHNILVGYNAVGLRIRVSDFGLARRVDALTLLASAEGTLAFKPPEFLQNVDSCASDVWAIGVTFYLLLTDRLPFPIREVKDVLGGSCWKHPLLPPSHFNPLVDRELDLIITQALSLEPEERYPDARAMLAALSGWKPHGNGRQPYVTEGVGESKTALGPGLQCKETVVEEILANAMELSRCPSKLSEAADLLEEVLNRKPELRDRFEYRLKLWRRGVAM